MAPLKPTSSTRSGRRGRYPINPAGHFTQEDQIPSIRFDDGKTLQKFVGQDPTYPFAVDKRRGIMEFLLEEIPERDWRYRFAGQKRHELMELLK